MIGAAVVGIPRCIVDLALEISDALLILKSRSPVENVARRTLLDAGAHQLEAVHLPTGREQQAAEVGKALRRFEMRAPAGELELPVLPVVGQAGESRCGDIDRKSRAGAGPIGAGADGAACTCRNSERTSATASRLPSGVASAGRARARAHPSRSPSGRPAATSRRWLPARSTPTGPSRAAAPPRSAAHRGVRRRRRGEGRGQAAPAAPPPPPGAGRPACSPHASARRFTAITAGVGDAPRRVEGRGHRQPARRRCPSVRRVN